MTCSNFLKFLKAGGQPVSKLRIFFTENWLYWQPQQGLGLGLVLGLSLEDIALVAVAVARGINS